MIEVQAVAKQFVQGRGRARRVVAAVQSVSFTAADGCITGLLGPNGAGKTTTLRMVAGLLVPDAGRIHVAGIDVAAQPQRAQARLGVLSDARGLYPRLSARENIVYYGRLHGLDEATAQARATEEIRKAVSTDEAKAVWANQGAEFANVSGPQFDAFVIELGPRGAAVGGDHAADHGAAKHQRRAATQGRGQHHGAGGAHQKTAGKCLLHVERS